MVVSLWIKLERRRNSRHDNLILPRHRRSCDLRRSRRQNSSRYHLLCLKQKRGERTAHPAVVSVRGFTLEETRSGSPRRGRTTSSAAAAQSLDFDRVGRRIGLLACELGNELTRRMRPLSRSLPRNPAIREWSEIRKTFRLSLDNRPEHHIGSANHGAAIRIHRPSTRTKPHSAAYRFILPERSSV